MKLERVDMGASRSARRLRRRILGALGMASPLLVPLAGCSTPGPNDEEGGVTTDPGNDSTNPPDSTTVEPETIEPVTEDPGTEDPDTEPDTGPDTEPPEIKLDAPAQSCTTRWFEGQEAVTAEYPDCAFGPFDPDIPIEFQEICVERPVGGDCADICSESTCDGMGPCYYADVIEVCGVYESADSCCIVIAQEQLPPIGRPFCVDGQLRLAETELEPVPAEPNDARLAAHWLETARGEHASIAAFARFIAQLQAFAAPASLLAEAIAAAGDEVRHTEDTLRLASRFAGHPLTLGALEIRDALEHANDLRAAVHDAVVEGCIQETLAAHEAACLTELATDPEVAASLGRVADDEARHAALAWRFVAWALDTHPELRVVVEQALASFELGPAPGVQANSRLLDYGCPSSSMRHRLRGVGLRELVSPCANRLLAAAQPSWPKV